MIYSLEISYATRSKEERVNQDNLIVDKYVSSFSEISYGYGYLISDTKENRVFAVADGAGGGLSGEKASDITIKTLVSVLDKIKSDCTTEALYKAIDKANLNVADFFKNYDGIGASTLSGIFFQDGNLHIFNIGDSPVYSLKKGKLKVLHQDHTLAAENLSVGKSEIIDPNSVEANTLTHYMGDFYNQASSVVHISTVAIESDTTYIISSDGVEKGLSERDIAKLISKKVDCNARKIVDKAYSKGALDDITVIVIKIHKTNMSESENND